MIGEQFIARFFEALGGFLGLAVMLVVAVVVIKYLGRAVWLFALWAIGDEIRWAQRQLRWAGNGIAAPFRHRNERKHITVLTSRIQDAEDTAALQKQVAELEARLEKLQPKDKK
jgi:ubiquinone biosynthesis protein UbiJ